MAHLAEIQIYGEYNFITVKERTDEGSKHSYSLTPGKEITESLVSRYSILDPADIPVATSKIKAVASQEWTDQLIQDYKEATDEND